ncbi:hypothetical protein WA158_007100 [Blastocystis sp. Blastoise]
MSSQPIHKSSQNRASTLSYTDKTEETLLKVAEKLSDYLRQTTIGYVRVTVTDFSICQYKKQHFASYKVIIERDGVIWYIWRRYSDFYNLHCHLVKEFNFALPPFPSKTFFKRLDKDFLFTRMKLLNDYIYQVCHVSVIMKDPVFGQFIQLQEHLQDKHEF